MNNPLTVEEQQLAYKQGRTSITNGKSSISSTPREIAMQNELQPLIDEGKITANKDPLTGNIKMEDQIKNGQAVSSEIKSTADNLRSGLQQLDAQDLADGRIQVDKNGFANKGVWTDSELVKKLYNTEDPLSIKSTDALTQNLDNSIYKLLNDTPKTREGLLDLRQNFDALVRKDYPNLYDGNMTPTRIKIQNLRENLNDFTASQLPEGKLPNGSSYRGELMKQHNLINAQDELAQKFVREHPEGSTEMQKIVKAHPELARLIKRVGYGVAIATVLGGSGYTIGKVFNKEIKSLFIGQ